jgi:hypothetical protein
MTSERPPALCEALCAAAHLWYGHCTWRVNPAIIQHFRTSGHPLLDPEGG